MLLTGFVMLIFFTKLGLMEFQVRYLALFLLFSVIGSCEWLWMGSIHKNIELITVLMMLSLILLSMVMILLSFLSVIRHLICGNNLNWLLNLNLIYETMWFINLNAGRTQLVSFEESNNTGPIDVKMSGSVLEEKSSFKMLGLTFSPKSDWGSDIISIAKTVSKKLGALIFSMMFLSTEVALYIYKSTICPCMKYCCHVWVNDPSCYLELSDKLQNRICRTVGPSLAATLEPLPHRRNVTSLSLFYTYQFGRSSSELAQLVPLPYFRGRSTRYSDRFHDFSVIIPRSYKDPYDKSLFACTARLRNSLLIECFHLAYNLNSFKSRITYIYTYIYIYI